MYIFNPIEFDKFKKKLPNNSIDSWFSFFVTSNQTDDVVHKIRHWLFKTNKPVDIFAVERFGKSKLEGLDLYFPDKSVALTLKIMLL